MRFLKGMVTDRNKERKSGRDSALHPYLRAFIYMNMRLFRYKYSNYYLNIFPQTSPLPTLILGLLVNAYTPLQAGAIPISNTCFLCFGLGSGLVNISAVWS